MWTNFGTWNEIVSRVAPLMINEAAHTSLRTALDAFVQERCMEQIVKHPELQGHGVHRFHITDECFHTIVVQLRALGLIARSEKNRSVKVSETYWTLTP